MLDWLAKIGLAGFGLIFVIVGILITIVLGLFLFSIIKFELQWISARSLARDFIVFILGAAFFIIFIGAMVEQPFLTAIWKDYVAYGLVVLFGLGILMFPVALIHSLFVKYRAK